MRLDLKTVRRVPPAPLPFRPLATLGSGGGPAYHAPRGPEDLKYIAYPYEVHGWAPYHTAQDRGYPTGRWTLPGDLWAWFYRVVCSLRVYGPLQEVRGSLPSVRGSIAVFG